MYKATLKDTKELNNVLEPLIQGFVAWEYDQKIKKNKDVEPGTRTQNLPIRSRTR